MMVKLDIMSAIRHHQPHTVDSIYYHYISLLTTTFVVDIMGKTYKNRGNVMTKAQKLAVRNYHTMSAAEQKALREDLVRSGFHKQALELNPTRSDHYNRQTNKTSVEARQNELQEQEDMYKFEQDWIEFYSQLYDDDDDLYCCVCCSYYWFHNKRQFKYLAISLQ